MSIGTQSQPESILTRSTSSIRKPKKSNSEVSKTYKHASQLYLTRRLVECYDALQPVIQPRSSRGHDDGSPANGTASASEDEARAPIARASTSQRIKIWSLYAALLNAIIELGDDEGKRDFGKRYREIVRQVQSSQVWEAVVRDGYDGREASVDAEVVYNLSNLLLQNAQDQHINQARLESYLSSSASSMNMNNSIDFSAAFDRSNGSFHSNGMDTPKDLNSRIKILELFTLHVLPQNDEWDYARSFVANSDILDEERREAFLQTLTELQEVKEQEAADAEAEADLVGFNEETETETDTGPEADSKIQINDSDIQLNGHTEHSQKLGHRRTSSEVDYGIDDAFQPPDPMQNQYQSTRDADRPPPRQTSPPSAPPPSAPPPSTATALSRNTVSPPPQPLRKSSQARKGPKAKNTKDQRGPLSKALLVLINLTSTLRQSLTGNPTQIFRTLMFLCAFLAVLARKDVRERFKRVIGNGWLKVRQTAGMGVKVSYV